VLIPHDTNDFLSHQKPSIYGFRIIEMAQCGLRDAVALQADALSYLQSNPPEA
jgi:hypothetical protein